MKAYSKSSILRYGVALGFGWCMVATTAVTAEQQAQPADAAATKPDAVQTPADAAATKPDAAAQTPAATMPLQKQAEATPATGSNIRRVRIPDSSLPLVQLDRAYIERSGATNAGELLRTVPQANSH